MLTQALISKILFPAPQSIYTEDSFPDELIWVSKVVCNTDSTLDNDGGDVPCLIFPYPYARFLMIYLHGNAEDLSRSRPFCCYLREQFQVHVLSVEYPGYGICPGMATEQSVMANVRAAIHFATRDLQWQLDGIMVFGRSIGTGPAVAIAAEFDIAGLVLVAPFLSVKELFHDRIGPLTGLMDVEEWFQSDKLACKITSPTLVIHGKRDRLINVRHGQLLYEHLRSPKMLVSPPHMEHNTNLISNLQAFVLPMFQFFPLPDCVFHEMRIPEWARRRRNTGGKCFTAPLGTASEEMGDQPMMPFVVQEAALGDAKVGHSEASRRNCGRRPQAMTRPRSNRSINRAFVVQAAIDSMWRRCCNSDAQPMERETEHSEEVSFMVSMSRSAPLHTANEESAGSDKGGSPSPAISAQMGSLATSIEPGPGLELRKHKPLRCRRVLAEVDGSGEGRSNSGSGGVAAETAESVHFAAGMADSHVASRERGGPPQGLWEMKLDGPSSELDTAAAQFGPSACQPCCDSPDAAAVTAGSGAEVDVLLQLAPKVPLRPAES